EESIEEIVEEPSVPEEVQVEPEPVAVEEPVEESAEEEVPAEEETIEEVPEPETAEETIEEVSEPETAEETVEEEPVDETLPKEDIEEILDLEVPVIELPVPSVPTLTTVDFDDEEIVDHDSVTDKDFELEGYNNPYKDDPFRFAAYDEFLSAKNNSYDLSICSIDAVVDEISLSLLGRGDTFINKGKTYVILPFLNKEESKSVMDGFGAPYNMECLVAGVGKDFEDILSSIA
ncbi:MAG: hypothetical protein HUK24_07575, partial [Sphaerochaetaceae bacterium]|nr:hypothetical protein [Sphaerochaetaceae bacterium]